MKKKLGVIIIFLLFSSDISLRAINASGILKKVEEFINGEQTRTVEQIMVRGDNIIYISP